MTFTRDRIAQGNYLVTGATGRTGSIVVRKLRDAGANVRALVHSTEPENRVRGVEYVTGDYQDRTSLDAACQGIDWVIACVGAQSANRGLDLIEKVEYQGTVNLVDAAKAAGARHVALISVRGADTRWDFYPVYPAKARADRRLIHSGIAGTVFRPGGMIDTTGAMLAGMARRVQSGDSIIIHGSADQAMVFIFLDELAEYLINAHLERRAHNRVLELGGPGNPTRAQFWQMVGDVTGVQPNVTYRSPDEIVPLREAAEKEENWPVAHQFAREEISGRHTSAAPPMNIYGRLLGVKQRDFSLWLLGVLRRAAAT